MNNLNTKPQETHFFYRTAALRDYDISPEQRGVIEAGPGELMVWGDFDKDWSGASPPGRRPKTPSGKDTAKALTYVNYFAHMGIDIYKTWAAHHTDGVLTQTPKTVPSAC